VGITAAGDSQTLVIAISGLLLVGGLVAIWWPRRDERDARLCLLFAIGGAALLVESSSLAPFDDFRIDSHERPCAGLGSLLVRGEIPEIRIGNFPPF